MAAVFRSSFSRGKASRLTRRRKNREKNTVAGRTGVSHFSEERCACDFSGTPPSSRGVIAERSHARGRSSSFAKREGSPRPQGRETGPAAEVEVFAAGRSSKTFAAVVKVSTTTCPRCVYIGVPTKKIPQFLGERLHGRRRGERRSCPFEDSSFCAETSPDDSKFGKALSLRGSSSRLIVVSQVHQVNNHNAELINTR